MPELPEVEVARRAIEPHLCGQTIVGAACRTPRLRVALDPGLDRLLHGLTIQAVRRRAKYLLIDCASESLAVPRPTTRSGRLLIHLGMSGSLRLCPVNSPAMPHDHFDLILNQQLLRLHDPRRFGAVIWIPDTAVGSLDKPGEHPSLASLGPEPFDPTIDGHWLHLALTKRRGPIKPVLMDNHLLVGIGNIYASESLFRAGISPLRAAHRISPGRCERLLAEVRATLGEAIEAGGSSLRDYVHTDGGAGCFQLAHAVYERHGAPCLRCSTPIRQIRQAGRSTYYCPKCQH